MKRLVAETAFTASTSAVLNSGIRRPNGIGVILALAALLTCCPLSPVLAQGGFGSAVLVENAGFPPKDIAVGDLNRDGAADIVTVDRSNSVIKVFLSDGRGNFPAGNMRHYQTGTTQANQPTLADLNRDGALDIILPRANGSAVSVFINNGDGTFRAKSDTTCGIYVWQVAVADFNRDGSPDLALAEFTSTTGYNSVRTLLNNGNGTFRQGGLFQLTTQKNYDFNLYSITAGDVNRDGNPDVAVNITNTRTVAIVYGNGNGTFRTGVSVSVPDAVLQDIRLQDINKDGRVDLVSCKSSVNKVTVGIGNGAGGFTFRDYSVSGTPVAFEIADVDRNGIFDIVTSNQSGDSITLLKGASGGTFGAGTSYSTGPGSNLKIQPGRIGLGDFNRDGRLDAAVGNSYINNSTGTRSTAVSVLLGK